MKKDIKKELQENGFIIIKDFYKKEELIEIYDEINDLGKFIIDKNFKLSNPFDEKYRQKQKELYTSLRYLVSLNRLASSKKNIDLAKNLGLIHPCIMNACNIRMDTPDNQNLFHWHQDTTYLLGSLNALTFWIPLTTVNLQNGTVELIPKSHNKGFFEYKNQKPLEELIHKRGISPKDIKLKKEPTENIIYAEAKPGDLIVFYQMLLHRSTPTKSSYTRWSVQLRYSDLKNPQFLEDSYPFGDITNIYNTKYTYE